MKNGLSIEHLVLAESGLAIIGFLLFMVFTRMERNDDRKRKTPKN